MIDGMLQMFGEELSLCSAHYMIFSYASVNISDVKRNKLGSLEAELRNVTDMADIPV